MQITQELEAVFQQKIRHPKDCNALAKDIVSITNRNISSSTLRRLFGLLESKSKLSNYNNETIRFYLEEKQRLKKKITNDNLSLNKDPSQEEYEQLKTLHNGLNESFIKDLCSTNIHLHKVFKLLRLSVIEALGAGNEQFILSIYRHNNHLVFHPYFCTFFGNQLNKNLPFAYKILPKLAEEKNGRRYFFQLYVDFGNFKTYKKWLQIYYLKEPDYLHKLWALSLIIYGNKLSNIDEDNWDDFFEILALCEKGLYHAHPYLKARVFGIGLTAPKRKEFFEKQITQQLNESKVENRIDQSFYPWFALMVSQYQLFFGEESRISKSIYEVLSTYLVNGQKKLDSALFFNNMLIKSKITGGNLGLNEIKIFNSDHTNEDIQLKLYALQFVKEEKLQYEVKKYKKQLIDVSGFVYFEDRAF